MVEWIYLLIDNNSFMWTVLFSHIVWRSDLRQQAEARGLTDVELGPNEHKLILHGEPELNSSQQRQIEKLQNALIQKQAELDALKLRVSIMNLAICTCD